MFKNENNDSIPFKKSYSLKTRSQSLEAILSNGITSADDLDVLRSNSVYPFCEVSSNLFNNYKSNLIFDEGILACAGSWIGPSLTKNQFKIWYQILCHANITTIENFGFWLTSQMNSNIPILLAMEMLMHYLDIIRKNWKMIVEKDGLNVFSPFKYSHFLINYGDFKYVC